MTEEYRPLYQWRPTWPGETGLDGKQLQDFQAFDNGESFGRIQRELTAHTKVGKWKWNITHIKWVKRNILPHGGWEDTAREASRQVEELYHKLCDLHGRKGSRQ